MAWPKGKRRQPGAAAEMRLLMQYLRDYMQRNQRTQRQMASGLGVSVRTLCRWLSGEDWPPAEAQEQIYGIVWVEGLGKWTSPVRPSLDMHTAIDHGRPLDDRLRDAEILTSLERSDPQPFRGMTVRLVVNERKEELRHSVIMFMRLWGGSEAALSRAAGFDRGQLLRVLNGEGTLAEYTAMAEAIGEPVDAIIPPHLIAAMFGQQD